MKTPYVFKFLFAVAFGVLYGECFQWDYERWHKLGRDAFLAYQGNRFDRYMANPDPAIFHIVAGILLIVGLAAIYEVSAFFAVKLCERKRGNNSAAQRS